MNRRAPSLRAPAAPLQCLLQSGLPLGPPCRAEPSRAAPSSRRLVSPNIASFKNIILTSIIAQTAAETRVMTFYYFLDVPLPKLGLTLMHIDFRKEVVEVECSNDRFFTDSAQVFCQISCSLDRESMASKCMDIYRNSWISKSISIEVWIIEDISIKHGYPFMDMYCLGISILECPCKDIRAWILMCVSTLVWIVEDTSENHGYPCRYPSIFGNNPCMGLLWILGPGLVRGNGLSVGLVSFNSNTDNTIQFISLHVTNLFTPCLVFVPLVQNKGMLEWKCFRNQ